MNARDPVVLIDFTTAAAVAAWTAVDDDVMGGVSSSRLERTPCGAAFTGHVSLEHGGGFASVRSGPRTWPATGARAFRLTARGDGRRYRLTLRTAAHADAVAYQAGFVAHQGWQAIELPLAAFVARRRGQPLDAAPPLDPARLRTLGLLIAERQAGDFRLELARIEAL